jgi:hypothetical protein
MRRLVLLCMLCLSLGMCSAWASTGSTNPSDFNNPVDWCTNFGCGGQQLGSPQAWTASIPPNTGLIGLVSSQNMENLQQSTSWNGNFANGMGVIYNGVNTLGNAPGGILVSFNQPVFGAGAYIQANFFGAFTGSIDLFDASFNPLGSFTAAGISDNNVGTALFIGAFDNVADVSYALFDTTANGFHDEDFAIGEMRLATTPVTVVPEPGTLLLLAPSMLGLAGVARRRLARKEVL